MASSKLSFALLAVALAACDDPSPQQARSPDRAPATQRQHTAPTGPARPPIETAPPPSSTASPIVPESPFTAESAQGAANVVQHYYALIEAGRYREAWQLRWDSAGPGLDRFVAGFAPYAEYHATIGAPSEIQGAAGSLYVDVPVQLYGRKKDGKPFGSAGTITLRRVNDVPGSTEAERRWRIFTKG